MSDEAAFLRAIQATPTDATAKLVYADWLDEHGEPERAQLLREAVTSGWPQEQHPLYPAGSIQTMFSRGGLGDAWRQLVRAQIPLWDPPTLLALGRLQGFLLANSYSNDRVLGSATHPDHHVYCNHTGEASLLPLGSVHNLATVRFADYLPVSLEPLQDWETTLRIVFTQWLFTDPVGAVSFIAPGQEAQMVRTGEGRGFVADSAVRLVRTVIRPVRGWEIRVTQSHYYAQEFNDLALEAADRVLFLHFSFTD